MARLSQKSIWLPFSEFFWHNCLMQFIGVIPEFSLPDSVSAPNALAWQILTILPPCGGIPPPENIRLVTDLRRGLTGSSGSESTITSRRPDTPAEGLTGVVIPADVHGIGRLVPRFRSS